MKKLFIRPATDTQGSALLIVLAFLLLLTTLTVAFLSRATFERQLSNASFSQGKVDLAGQGAITAIIGDLQTEIVAGSNSSALITAKTIPDLTQGGAVTGYYYPNSPATVIPAIVGFTPAAGLEDLLKISYPSPFYSGGNYNTTSYPAPNRASTVATTTTSLNGRSVTAVRWNQPLLLAPKSSSDFTPSGSFIVPDWIYVARDGSNPTSTTWSSSWEYLPNIAPTTATGSAAGTNPVTQRYAYAIYDEGSTLDLNVAGSPVTGTSGATVTYSPNQPYKNALAYADLTQLPGISGLAAANQQAFVNAIVGWRNFASAGLASSNVFPNTYTFPTATPPALTAFDQNVIFNPGGFLTVGNTGLATGKNHTGTNNQSDNAFASRQQLLQFFLQGLGQNSTFTGKVPLTNLVNVLPYLGTFSRDISQPSYAPNPNRPAVLATANGGNAEGSLAGAPSITNDNKVNPAFLATTVTTAFTRNDGSTATVGEPLVKKRFALNRLAWITYKGPSANRTMTDPDMAALIADGIPQSFLLQGTAANIQKYFGLDYVSGSQWKYDYHNGGGVPASGSSGPIMQLGAIAALGASAHDPDFFELLKAGIGVGSVGKALANSGTTVPKDTGANSQGEQPYNYNWASEYDVDYQILQVGANIIAQFQPTDYAPQIIFDDGTGSTAYNPRTVVGVENLPYLAMVMNGTLNVQNGSASGAEGTTGTVTTTGTAAWMQEPVIWNPHDPSSSPGLLGPTSFRILADSATPDQAVIGPASGIYNSFFAFSAALNLPSNGINHYSSGASGATTAFTTSTNKFTDPGTGANLGQKITAANSEIDLTVTSGTFSTTKVMCPEPVILMRSSFTDSSGIASTVSVPATNLMRTDTNVSTWASTSGLKSVSANAPQMPTGETSNDPAGTSYIGFYLGASPWWWTEGTTLWTANSAAFLARAEATSSTPPGSGTACYMTYRMQYYDTNASAWVTYDTKYGQAYATGHGTAGPPGVLFGATDWAFAADPRTSRFGLLWNGALTSVNNNNFPGTPPPDSPDSGGYMAQPLPINGERTAQTTSTYGSEWLDTLNGIIYTIRPDADAGYYTMHSFGPSGSPTIGPSSGWMAYVGSSGTSGGAIPGIAPGLLSQNNTDIYYYPHRSYKDSQGSGTQTPNYFADPDGMVRRAMGAYVPLGNGSPPEGSPVPADTTVGLPMARVFNYSASISPTPTSPTPTITVYPGTPPTSAAPTSQSQSRPYFLHRPFYSVAELGYVFSDTPWRNLDFFTSESGDTALLDVFCINDTNDPGGLVAGKVDLNTRQAPVLQAVIAGGCADPGFQQPLSGSSGPVGQIDSTTAQLVAQALVARTTDTANIANGTGPLQNVSELVGKWVKPTGGGTYGFAINDLGALITGFDKGTLASANNFYDGKLSYAGFSGGVWDTTNHKPYPDYTPGSVITGGGVENFSTGAAQSTSAPEDVYSAYMSSTSLKDNSTQATNHKGPQETAAYIQRFREAPIRALAAAGTTRVWNLMIDVIAQTGRFPSSAGSLANFNVEGERRYWVHVAIDRYTGKVLDEQVEEVKE